MPKQSSLSAHGGSERPLVPLPGLARGYLHQAPQSIRGRAGRGQRGQAPVTCGFEFRHTSLGPVCVPVHVKILTSCVEGAATRLL